MRHHALCYAWFWILLSCLTFTGCGGSGDTSSPTPTKPVEPTVPVEPPAYSSGLAVTAVRAGSSPFIAFVDIGGVSVGALREVRFRIEPKPGSASAAINVSYSAARLRARGYLNDAAGSLTLPVFGLYAGYANRVDLTLVAEDGGKSPLDVVITTDVYADPNGIYDRPTIRKARQPFSALDFSFFFMKSNLGSPVVVDSDAEIRWTAGGMLEPSTATAFDRGVFVTGINTAPVLRRLELDGTASRVELPASDVKKFHHNIDHGKRGLLAEVDVAVNGIDFPESVLVELDPTSGAILSRWDLGEIVSRQMRSMGDDPALFVRPGSDWFHMNAAAYDASDDSLVVSSRESFVVKIDYETGDIRWILGDPTKYWFSFPSLVAKSLNLDPGGIYPMGQHAVSITHDGRLMLFNNGAPSFNQPANASVGASSNYSSLSTYSIDASAMRAVEVQRFDYERGIYSDICSSGYEAAEGKSRLVSYAVAEGRTRARLVGLDAEDKVVFDFEYVTVPCGTSWNAMPIALDSLRLE